MRKRTPYSGLALLLTGLMACAPLAAMPFEACLLSDVHGSTQREARCARLEVPENHRDAQSRKLSLHIALIESKSEQKSTPLYFLPGGPGQAASLSYVKLAPVLRRLAGKRDIVLLDQRGTGKSSPLECNPPDDTLGATAEGMARWAEQCLAELNGDPRYYTTAAAVADLETVRQALGHGQINLYGVSYGTRLALEYMRHHGAHVRGAILDGVAGFDYVIGEDTAQLSAKVLDRQFERCQRETACHEHFSDPRLIYQTLLEKLKQRPLMVNVAHPTRGDERQVELTRDSLHLLVRTMLYTMDYASLLPLLLHQAHNDGNYKPLAAQSLFIGEAMLSDISYPLHYSVVCAEDAPWHTPTNSQSQDPGELAKHIMQTVCARWPHAPADEVKLHQAYAIQPPTLMFSGGYDPVTPADLADKLTSHLRNGKHIVVEEAAHNVLVTRCPLNIAREFLRQPSFEELPVQCLKHSKPPPFFIDPHGPAS